MKPKIKILHIIKSLGRGGAEMLLPETLKLHNQEQFEFHYIYFLPWKNQLEETIREAGGIIQCISASNNIVILLQAAKIAKYIKKHKINVVHAHLPWAGFVSRLVYKLSGIPVLYSEHNKQERYHGITFFLNKLTFNWQQKAIAVSEDVAASIQKNIRPSIPVSTILNGVNTSYFNRKLINDEREKIGIPKDTIVVGTVAVFRFQKRLKEWLDVFSKASALHPNLYGILVGDGPLKEEILRHRKNLGLEDKILMPGLQTEVKPWYASMDIFMMTSSFEGLPIALLEAMSMECAIVSTNAGGIKEVIKHNENGLMREVDEWESLSDDISLLVNDPVLRNQLSKAGRIQVMKAFSVERMVKELEEIYKGAVKNLE